MSSRVTIIDDDVSIREALSGLLAAVGLETEAFASAEEFLGSDRLANTDCLVLDLTMPGMGGLELQSRLATSHPRLPIIFVTATEDASLRTIALQAGAFDYLQKPLNDEALLNAVQRALKTS
jgi:FixJ family two-component response regulator